MYKHIQIDEAPHEVGDRISGFHQEVMTELASDHYARRARLFLGASAVGFLLGLVILMFWG